MTLTKLCTWPLLNPKSSLIVKYSYSFSILAKQYPETYSAFRFLNIFWKKFNM